MFVPPPIIFYTALSLIRYFMYLIHTNALQEAFTKLRYYCPDSKWFTNVQ